MASDAEIAGAAALRPIEGAGIDLSAPAAGHAARRFPDLTWIVANADRRLPLIDRSVNLVWSLHARRHPVECARVLAPGGFLLIAVPAQDDLIELRAMVQGEAIERERADVVVEEHASRFRLVERSALSRQATLEPETLRDMLRVTYRGERTRTADRVATLAAMDVTLSSELLLFCR